MQQQEASFGLEHQLIAVMARQRPLRPQAARPRDRGHRLARRGRQRDLRHRQPGRRPDRARVNATRDVDLPKAKRDYDGVEFAFDEALRRTTGTCAASYLWSRLYGNYSGLSQSDENGRTNPNVGRAFDYPIMMFDENGQPAYGPLATDRPHQFKAQFIYALPFGTTHRPEPVRRERHPGHARNGGAADRATTRCSTWAAAATAACRCTRRPTCLIQHEFRLGGDRQLQLSFNVLNLFNQQIGDQPVRDDAEDGTASSSTSLTSTRARWTSIRSSRRFRRIRGSCMDNGYQAPISARFGVRFLF